MTNSQKLLTPDEVSHLLGIKIHTLAVWRSSGRYNLPFIKAGRLVRYRQSDIDTFLNNQSYLNTGYESMGAESK